jgi:hypothetical protein
MAEWAAPISITLSPPSTLLDPERGPCNTTTSGRASPPRSAINQHDTLPGPSRDLRAARAGNQGQDADGGSRGHQRRRAAGHLIVPPAAAPSGQGAAAGPIQSHEDAGVALTLAAVMGRPLARKQTEINLLNDT